MIQFLLILIAVLLLTILFFIIFNTTLRGSRPPSAGDDKYEKICPLCRKELKHEEEIFGKLSDQKHNQVIILGCPYCYHPKRKKT